jgi:hypothetical protein
MGGCTVREIVLVMVFAGTTTRDCEEIVMGLSTTLILTE